MASYMLNAGVLTLIGSIASVCLAGDYCGDQYCTNGCCGVSDSYCCVDRSFTYRTTTTTRGTTTTETTSAISNQNSYFLLPGILVGGGVLVAVCIVVIIICVCRKRRSGGVVYGTATVQQIAIQDNVTAAVIQPGATYPQPPYTWQPAN